MSEEKQPGEKLARLLRRRRNKRVASLAVLLIALPLLAWFLWQHDIPGEVLDAYRVGPPAAPSAEAPTRADPAGQSGAEARLESASPPARLLPSRGARSDLPELDESDAYVRRAVALLAKHPELVRWLASDDLVRRFVAAVDNVAEGRSPRRHLEFLEPPGAFLVAGDGEGSGPLLADPVNERRYDAVVSVMDAIDPADGARLYASLQPLFQEAYVDLGYPDASFDDRLKGAAYELLAAPILPDPPQLIPQVARFEYADPALEDLSDAQKHLLRMGPRNVDRLQRKLRVLLGTIDPSWKPPPMQVYRSPSLEEGAAANQPDE